MNIFKIIKSWFQKRKHQQIKSKQSNSEETIEKLQIKHHKIILNANDFLDNRVVLYFERTNHSLINDYISINYENLEKAFKEKGLQFVHIPSTGKFKNIDTSQSELIDYLRYKYPFIFNESEYNITETINSVIGKLDIQLYYNTIGDILGVPAEQKACFIHSVDLTTENNEYRKWEYSCFYLDTIDETLLAKQIEFYLKHTGIPTDRIFFSLKKEDKLDYDADERFDFDGSKISPEINNAIEQIKSINNEKLLISSILYLIDTLKESNPTICEKLNHTLLKQIKSTPIKLSRLKIDEQFRIWLPEYNNTEIEMTPLPKTFYIFMLKHPEGISFKYLSDHKKELLEIYSRIGNRYDLDRIKQSINDIADIRSNSVNEKCSRIKEAFLFKIDESIAHNYYITGGRNELKKIKLDSSLIQLPKNL